MGRFIAGLLIGIVVGGALIYLGLIGLPKSGTRPGQVVQAPDPSGAPPGTAQIVIRPELLNTALSAIFTQLKPPTFPLGSKSESCSNDITILPEGSGARTVVNLESNHLNVPLAFTGNYGSPVGCIPFSGWAQSNLELRFDPGTQSVFGVVNVETVSLDGVNPIWNALITPLVQSTINTRVNPIKLVDGRQLAVSLPIVASNGELKAGANDVRAEVKDNALNLYVIYSFNGSPAQPAAQ